MKRQASALPHCRQSLAVRGELKAKPAKVKVKVSHANTYRRAYKEA